MGKEYSELFESALFASKAETEEFLKKQIHMLTWFMGPEPRKPLTRRQRLRNRIADYKYRVSMAYRVLKGENPFFGGDEW